MDAGLKRKMFGMLDGGDLGQLQFHSECHQLEHVMYDLHGRIVNQLPTILQVF